MISGNGFAKAPVPTLFTLQWFGMEPIGAIHIDKRRKEMLNVKISSNSSKIEIIAQVKTTLSQVQTLHRLLRNESHVKERKQKSVNAMNYRIRIN